MHRIVMWEHGHIGKYSILSIAKTYKHPKYKVREP
jgi:hypothetical protein